MVIAGTEGYAEDASSLIERYERVAFIDKYACVLHLIPKGVIDVLDIGAGTGADAAWLAEEGHQVLAVEPLDRFRNAAKVLHPSPRIEWVADSLPGLRKLVFREQHFDLVLLSAVWMHLAQHDRQEAMFKVATLLKADGVLLISLRHGPVPANRRMFRVSAKETIQLAEQEGLSNTLNVEVQSTQLINRQAGVTWSWHAFSKCET